MKAIYYLLLKNLTKQKSFPQSIWAPRSALMAAYSYYSYAYYGDAINEAERYLKRYPKDKNLAGATILLDFLIMKIFKMKKKS